MHNSNSSDIQSIPLEELVNASKRDLIQTSKKLARGEAKLNQTNFKGIFQKKCLSILFSQIPNEYLSPDKIHRYFDGSYNSNELVDQLSDLHDSRSKNKILATITQSMIRLLVIPLFLYLSYKGIEFSVKPKLNIKSLKIGTLWKPENYSELEKYLENELIPNNFINFLKGDKLNIVLEGDKTLSYAEAKNRILDKDWDIAFTLSPMISIAAKKSDYAFAARMFPDEPAYYRSAIYARSDSRIKSLSDLNSSITIAMGEVDSASSFYMPAYDLFGKTLTVNLGHRGQKIRELVKSGKVDLGASAWEDTVKSDPSIRVIHLSRKVPSSGVYLSPRLLPSDQDVIRETLLKAPEKVREQANFGNGDEPDYRSFSAIVQRTEELLHCADFEKNPVSFFCPPATNLHKTQVAHEINGLINGFSQINDTQIKVIIEGEKDSIYEVIFPSNWLSKYFRISALNLQNKKVILNKIKFNRLAGNIYSSTLTESDQLRVVD